MITTYPLHLAAQLRGNLLEVVRALFASKSPPSALVKDSLGLSAIFYAIMWSTADMVELLCMVYVFERGFCSRRCHYWFSRWLLA
jgi:hypothetical protein